MKRLERSFVHRGLVLALVGAVVCIPGALLLWWPAVLGLENSRNVRPVVMAVSLVAGLALVLAGLAWAGWWVAKGMVYRRARRTGHKVQADVLCVDVDWSRPAFGKPAYVVRCLYTAKDGKKHLFRSPPLKNDPTKTLAPEVAVWCDPDNYRCHYVDVAGGAKNGDGPDKAK